MSFNAGERLFLLTLSERFDIIHVTFMIMIKKKEEEDIVEFDAVEDSAILIIIRVAKKS